MKWIARHLSGPPDTSMIFVDTANAGEIDPWMLRKTVAKRLNRDLGRTIHDNDWIDVQSILWFPLRDARGETMSGSQDRCLITTPRNSFVRTGAMGLIGSVTGSAARAGSFRGPALKVIAGTDVAKVVPRLRDVGIYIHVTIPNT
jgi:hypothetical protein